MVVVTSFILILSSYHEWFKNMCEFTVFLNKEIVCRDIIYAKMERSKVLLKDVLGIAKTMENCKIIEVDVSSERLVLASK